MKRLLYLALLSLIMVGCRNGEERIFLTDWHFDYNGLQRYTATVPSFIHTDLMANGLIPDPYYGTNEDSTRWVEDKVWSYRYHINRNNLPKGDTLWLVFEGIAGRANVIFYGQRIKNMRGELEKEYTTDNMFVQYIFPLPPNCEDIEVMFLPLNDSLAEQKYGIPLPDRRAFTRIAPYQQGWDWGPKLPTCGIWKPVYITNKPHIFRDSNTANNSRVSSITLLQKPDSIGQSFSFYQDGKPIFIKGANWIPAHSFPVMTPDLAARYRMLLCSAKEANFNMIRVWGGGIYEHDYFFDLCDSLGIMVWMDFNFSTMLYPNDNVTLTSIYNEARQNVARIAQHPCVVLWCGNNEVKNGWEDGVGKAFTIGQLSNVSYWKKRSTPFSDILIILATLVQPAFSPKQCMIATLYSALILPHHHYMDGGTQSAPLTATATIGAFGGAKSLLKNTKKKLAVL